MSSDKKQSLAFKRIQLLDELTKATKAEKVSWETTAEKGLLVASSAMTLHIVPLMKNIHWGYRVELADNSGAVIDEYSVEKIDSGIKDVLEKIRIKSDPEMNLRFILDSLYVIARESIETRINLQMDRFIEGLRA